MIKTLDEAIERLDALCRNATPFNEVADAADMVLKELYRFRSREPFVQNVLAAVEDERPGYDRRILTAAINLHGAVLEAKL